MTTFDYKGYWEDIYRYGGTSGNGSYGEIALFKANIVNNIIEKYNANTVIEFGCGDGNQLGYMNYNNYIGFDISNSAVERCRNLYINDNSKEFIHYTPDSFDCSPYRADMVVCLDVLYHITDENDFVNTLTYISKCASKVVVLFTKLTTSYQEHSSCPSILDRDIYSYLNNFSNLKIVDTITHQLNSSASFLILEVI